MRPVFANSAWVAAPERLMLRGGRWRRVRLRVRYALVRHPQVGPVLIDTGYTPHVTQGAGRSRALRLYGAVLRPELIDAEQPAAFLAAHGLSLDDVSTIVITHFHADHVAGLALFPQARIIASGAAWAALQQGSARAALRHGVFKELFPADLNSRLDAIEQKPQVAAPGGLGQGADLLGDGSMLAISLPGHADGQVGLLFPSGPRPLLYAVDTQWLLPALLPGKAPGFPARLIAQEAGALAATTRRVHRFQAEGGEVVLCHDPAPTAYDFTPPGATS